MAYYPFEEDNSIEIIDSNKGISIQDFFPGYRPPAAPFHITYLVFPCELQLYHQYGRYQITDEMTNVKLLLGFDRNASKYVALITLKLKRTDQSESSATELSIEKITHWRHVTSGIMIDIDLCKVWDIQNLVSDSPKNEFNFVIKIIYENGQEISQNTRTFKLVKLVKENESNPLKRKGEPIPNDGLHPKARTNLGMSNLEGESPSSSTQSSPELTKKEMKFGNVNAEKIKTRTIQVDKFCQGKTIQTSNGDIAYHFYLNDESQMFSEGEVVGFVEGKDNLELVKLTLTTKDSIIKGVITRSQYFEAQKPKENDPRRSETICMMGSVPVQVVGSVNVNDLLFASPYNPGVAISGHYLNYYQEKSAAYVGVAQSSRQTKDEKSVGMVNALVSLVEGCSQVIVNKALRKLDVDFEENIVDIKKKSSTMKKVCICSAITFLLFLVLLGIFLWQIYTPGSAYRYYYCLLDSVPHGITVTFTFIPYSHRHKNPEVTGKEFNFNVLMKKMGHNYQQIGKGNNSLAKHQSEGYRYFLNVDRCAYGSLRTTRDYVTNGKEVFGPTIFGADAHFNRLYYYNEDSKKWKAYNSARWDWFKNVKCKPETEAAKKFRKTYGQCEKGVIKSDLTSTFKYTPKGHTREKTVNGIKFDLKKLGEKLNLNLKELNLKSISYYYNIDQCMSSLTNASNLKGPTVFALDGLCNTVYIYTNKTKSNWRIEPTASWEKYNNVECRPATSMSKRFRNKYQGCRENRLKPNAAAVFQYISPKSFTPRTARGIEFSFESLKSKVQFQLVPHNLGNQTVHYYLNIDRCVGKYWYKSKKLYGARVFSIDEKCDRVYYYSILRKNWNVYKSGRNITCFLERNQA